MCQSIENEHLNEVINCLQQQQKEIIPLRMSSQSIPVLYESTKKLLQTFQHHFNRCKKYNQAKIHRKYEIIINSLAQQNKNLKYKIAMQLQSRPGSQIYVSDLINKMIQLKNYNEKMTKENINLKNMIQKLQENNNNRLVNSNHKDDNNPQYKDMMKKQWQKILIRDTTNRYFRLKKEEEGNQINKEQSNFQKFLHFNQSKLDKWYLIDLFQRIEKWTNNLKDIRFIDKSKIKSSFQKDICHIRNTHLIVPEKSMARLGPLEHIESKQNTILKKYNSRRIKSQINQPYYSVVKKTRANFRSNLSNYNQQKLDL